MKTRAWLSILLIAPLIGCIGTDEDVAPASTDGTGLVGDEVTGPVTDTLEGLVQFGIATPARSFNSGGAFQFPLARSSNHTGYVLEVVWDAFTPASQELDLWVRDAASGSIPPTDPNDVTMPAEPVVRVTGASPIRVALPATDLEDGVDYSIIVRAPSGSGAGVAANQAYTLYVTTFSDMEFDAEFTAIQYGVPISGGTRAGP